MSQHRISNEALDEIISSISLVEVVREYVDLDQKEDTRTGVCPFCNSRSFTVDASQRIYTCGECTEQGSVIHFLMKMKGITFVEACRRLADQVDVEINESDGQTYVSKGEDRECLELYEWASDYFETLLWNTDRGTRARAYLYEQSIDDATIRTWSVGVAPPNVHQIRDAAREDGFDPDGFDRVFPQNTFQFGQEHDQYPFQLMFPLRDYRNRVTGYAWRKVASDQHVTNSITMHPRMYMYGVNRCDQQKIHSDGVWIVNQRLEVITAHQNGLEMVVSPPKFDLPQVDRVVLLSDRKRAMIWSERKRSHLYRDDRSVEVGLLPEGEDLCSMLSGGRTDDLHDIAASATALADFNAKVHQE
jgi:DNA primase